ncbi:hypothetical protein [Streptomyces griseus]|uniref:hypothetical protein n=1 Tax=Streptomyces griseus TaxID=1911 RepID=UPI00368998A5
MPRTHPLSAPRRHRRPAPRPAGPARGRRRGPRRLLVQRKIGTGVTQEVSKPFAEADHLLLTGDPTGAVDRPRTAYRAAQERRSGRATAFVARLE